MAKLTEEEMKMMNEIIRPTFGANLQITAGSREGTIYHLVIGNPINFVSESNMQNIGKMLKEKYEDATYFSRGSRIA